MKVLIEIDEKLKYAFDRFEGSWATDTVHSNASAIAKAIKNGTALPQNATNGQTFIDVFGIDAWKQMIEFSNLNEQFREFWNAPYKAESGDEE